MATLRIVSWNVHRCIGTDGRFAPERIARCLSPLNADVIALQEIDNSLRTVGEKDQLSFIADSLGMKSIMGPTLTRGYGVYGNAILYKAPLTHAETLDLSFRKFEPRGALAVHLRFPQGVLRVVSCHLGLKYWERAFQIDRLLRDFVWREGALTCVAGDFNEWITFSPNAFRLKQTLHSGTRFKTFPSAWPRFSLDRIFFNWPAAIGRSQVVATREASTASDHLPLVTEVEFDGSEAFGDMELRRSI